MEVLELLIYWGMALITLLVAVVAAVFYESKGARAGYSEREKQIDDNQKPQHGLSHDPGCFGATKETISVNDDQHGKKDHQPQQKQHTCKTDPFR